jgi:asparagine synthase (glutamine-hydrolysing)
MCGIAGVFDPTRRLGATRLQHVAETMAARLVHRGPDDHGAWVSEDGLCALSHRRLTIIDSSQAGRQPMGDGYGRLTISFNGEIYNYRELRDELSRSGTRFLTRTDTEVLIAAFEAFGERVYYKVEGMYAFAMFDSRTRELTLARDPFGEKPLFYTTQGGAIAFASELDALRAVPWFEPDVRIESVAGYLALQYVQSPSTLYRDTFKVDPGSWIRVDAEGRIRSGRHFDFDPRGSEEPAEVESRVDELDEAVTQAVRGCMVSDFPVGTYLSSGVDSSLVTAIAARLTGHPIRTFSIGFGGAGGSEHGGASETAASLHCEHSTRMLWPDVLDTLPAIAAAMDEPNGDTSCLPTYHLSASARAGVKVALSGDGGDELFGGYDTYLSLVPAAEGGRALPSGGSTVGTNYLRMMSTFSRDEIVQLLGVLPRETDELLSEVAAIVDREDRPLVSRLRLADATSFLPGSVLAKVDRMSMAHSLEVRSPFLNRTVAAIAARLRPDECIAHGQGKVLLRRLAKRYLPAEWMDRPKKGFGFPAGWLPDGAITAAAREYFEGGTLRHWFGQRNLERFLRRQRDPLTANVSQVWRLLILELWFQSHAGLKTTQPDDADQALRVSGTRQDELTLARLTPSQTSAGVAFNVQADGSAALSVMSAHAGPWTSIVIDGEELQTTYGSGGELSALVPERFYAGPGVHRIHLVDGERTSNALTFEVHPRLEAEPLVSVVIPCFNQGRFLGESIESALRQIHPALEVIVIDDGSTDETSAVAARYESVRYIRQENKGLPAARNRGLTAACGEFVIFLDADDRLLPTAAALGVRAMREAPEAAFAFGHYRSVTESGAVLIEAPPSDLGPDPYAAFLGCNIVGTTASAIFRTAVLRELGGFDCSPRCWGCEDYELYLRISRDRPVSRYHDVVAEYRLHAASMSRNTVRMLGSVVSIVRSHRASVRGDALRESALQSGLRAWREVYVPSLLAELVARRRQLGATAALKRLIMIVRAAPREAVKWGLRMRCSPAAVFVVSEDDADSPARRPEAPPTTDGIRLIPGGTPAGRPFNLQPSGMSALAVECRDARPESIVVFGETLLRTTYGSPTLLTALVPGELYRRPGAFPVYVVGFGRLEATPDGA